MFNEAELKAQREAIVKQRDNLVMEANAQIAWMNGQIALIDQWLGQQMVSTPAPPPNGQHEAEAVTA